MRASRGPRRLAAEMKLVAAFAAMVGCFVAATTITNWSASGIQTAALGISANAAPSLVKLAEAREALRHLQVRLNILAEQSTAQPLAAGLAVIEGRQRLLRAAIAGYQVLPVVQGEREQWPEIEAAPSAFAPCRAAPASSGSSCRA